MAWCLVRRDNLTVYLHAPYSILAAEERSLLCPLQVGTGRVVPFAVGWIVPIFRNQPVTLILFPSEGRYVNSRHTRID
jgi:hypothetical protein